jgi:hypothetical protein
MIVLLPQTKTCPLALGKGPVAGSQDGPVYSGLNTQGQRWQRLQ